MAAALAASTTAEASTQELSVEESVAGEEVGERGAKPLGNGGGPLPQAWIRQSAALLIGNSNYQRGWEDLGSVPRELVALRAVLEEHGFAVEVVADTTAAQLVDAFKSFIDRHGYEPENRLLFYFAGHGFTRDGEGKAYLVPVDAPLPTEDEPGFLEKALPMLQVMAWARQLEAKHALFLFDSCFSGSIFRVRSGEEVPRAVSAELLRPVRQFITAGSARERVPAQSVFNPLLVRGLRGAADLDRDGYILGTELGLYLRREVIEARTGQTPQAGKIRDPDLDQGDFVFQLGSTRADSLSDARPPVEVPGPLSARSGEDAFAGCRSLAKSFDEEPYPVRPGYEGDQFVGEWGVQGGEFKISMVLPRRVHARCVPCGVFGSSFRVEGSVRSSSFEGSWGIYFLGGERTLYALELERGGNALIKHYTAFAADAARNLWQGPVAARALNRLRMEAREGWLRSWVNDQELPRQRLDLSTLPKEPLNAGMHVVSGTGAPVVAFFDDYRFTACAP